jgi:hypothetical protein
MLSAAQHPATLTSCDPLLIITAHYAVIAGAQQQQKTTS